MMCLSFLSIVKKYYSIFTSTFTFSWEFFWGKSSYNYFVIDFIFSKIYFCKYFYFGDLIINIHQTFILISRETHLYVTIPTLWRKVIIAIKTRKIFCYPSTHTMGSVFSLHQEYQRLSTNAKIRMKKKVVKGKNNDEGSGYDPSLATSNSANNQETSCLVDILNIMV